MSFAWPLALWALALIPLLLALYVRAQRRRRSYALRFTNLALLRTVAGNGPGARRHIPPLLYLLGLAALLVGIARPSAVIALPRNQATMMLVVDTSGSMSADDLRPNRMAAAQEAAEAFVAALPADVQVGLVSFTTSAVVNAPPTRDRELLRRAIAGLRAGGGTAIGEGLHLALDQLEQQPAAAGGPAPRTVVLLSDGESQAGRAPMEAAERAQAAGVRVQTVGVGERGASPVIGNNQRAGLDEATLRRVAEQTGGEYFYAQETDDLARIYADLGAQVGLVEERVELTALLSALAVMLLLGGGALGLRWFQRLP